MKREIIDTLHEYFNTIQNPTAKEREILENIKGELPYFQVTAISRDDLKQRGFDVEKITDAEMEELASKMEERYIPNSFWDDMDELAGDIGLPMRDDIVPCPECDSFDTDHEPASETYICNTCEYKWDNKNKE